LNLIGPLARFALIANTSYYSDVTMQILLARRKNGGRLGSVGHFSIGEVDLNQIAALHIALLPYNHCCIYSGKPLRLTAALQEETRAFSRAASLRG
jgi:hypothetical protein